MSATGRTAASRLEREFWAYWMVKIQQHSPGDIAAALEMPPAEIFPAVQRMEQLLVSAAPAVLDEAEEGRRMYVSNWLAGQRLEHLIQLAERSWEQSQGKRVTERESNGEFGIRRTITTTSSPGDPRYLAITARLVLLASKLPVLEQPLLGASASETRRDSPLKEDCSAESSQRPIAASFGESESIATCSNKTPCDDSRQAASEPKVRSAQTVQPVQDRTDRRSAASAIDVDVDSQLPQPMTPHQRQRDPSRKKARRTFFAAAG